MSEEMRVSCFIEKEKIRPWGLFGGEPGKNSAIMVSQDGGETFRTLTEAFGVACNGKFSDVYLARGDSIRIVTSGGGGYGHRLSARSTGSRRTSGKVSSRRSRPRLNTP